MANTNRSPIVAVLGHVDHGKTTLLDAVRKTKVASREAGGITQSIGASIVATKQGKKITFIDTPGHAAFSKMRSRGAKVADIAILVVSADDGVKPQTKEALKHILEAEIPYVVAITKIDLISANEESVKGQLEKEGVLFEGRGGDVPVVLVSAKKNKGLDELLEMIELISEVNSIKADAAGKLEAVVIETGRGKAGPTVSVVVRNGSLKVGDLVSTGTADAKVRGLFDDQNKSVKQVGPGEPVLILGFSKLPEVGAKITLADSEKKLTKGQANIQLAALEVKEGQLPIVIKVQSAGSMEALIQALPEEVVAVASGVGDLVENDVFQAKSSGASIFVFESKVPKNVALLADTESVVIEKFDLIYKLLERLQEIIEEGKQKVLGKAEIINTFPFNKKTVAGSKVISGKISRVGNLVLMRGEKQLGEIKIISMKKVKEDIQEALQGEEFGMIFTPQLDFEIGDMVVSVAK